MKIKGLKVQGYRCLENFSIDFEPDVTVIIGENDSGKSTVIDCLRIFVGSLNVELEDFNPKVNEITLELELEDFIYKKRYERVSEGGVERSNPLPTTIRPHVNYLKALLEKLSSDDFDPVSEVNEAFMRGLAGVFGLSYRSNTNRSNLAKSIANAAQSLLDDPEACIQAEALPAFTCVQLDGKHFENASVFFKEVFLKEKQALIWNEEISPGLTVEQFVKTRIDEYTSTISKEIAERGVQAKIQEFLGDLTEIKIEPLYRSRDLNIDAKVMFLQEGQEINLNKKGDGTKRRITMALLDFKHGAGGNAIYLLDEPDTHLHAKAQLELLQTLERFGASENQVILTTHSPFIMNAVKPHQVRMLSLANGTATISRRLEADPAASSSILRELGVDNVYLFFARTILLVEGQTEENFISHYFLKKTGRVISSNLVKIISVDGIQNIRGFAKAILELHDKQRILVMFDNDVSEELRELIDQLDIAEDQKFVLGEREFEDAFSDSALYSCWKTHLEGHNSQIPKDWTEENISRLRAESHEEGTEKFSERLRSLNGGGKRMTKPIFGIALGKYLQEAELPEKLRHLFAALETA